MQGETRKKHTVQALSADGGRHSATMKGDSPHPAPTTYRINRS